MYGKLYVTYSQDSIMDYITLYTSDGSLNLPQEEKEPFREWAYNELSIAFPGYEISVSKEPSTEGICFFSNEKKLKKENLTDFVDRMFERWERIQKKGR